MKISIMPFLVKKLRQLIGPVEDTDTASQSYNEGDYVVWKGKLTKANTTITQAETLSDTNLDETDVGEELKAINAKFTSGAITHVDPEEIAPIIEDWLDDHPEATTTV